MELLAILIISTMMLMHYKNNVEASLVRVLQSLDPIQMPNTVIYRPVIQMQFISIYNIVNTFFPLVGKD